LRAVPSSFNLRTVSTHAIPHTTHYGGTFAKCPSSFNLLKPNGNYVPPASTINNFLIYGFLMILTVNRDYFLNSINKLIFVMKKCRAFFAVRTEFLYIRRASTSKGQWKSIFVMNSQ
jgi:hypothetical protein